MLEPTAMSRLYSPTLRLTLPLAVLVSLLVVPEVRSAPEAARPRLLLMDLRSRGVDEHTTRTIQDLLALELARSQRYDVVSGDELRQVLALQSDKQLVGCEESSCLSEIAGALGASLVVFGSVGTLGELTLVNLSLFDAAEVRAVRRVDLRVRALDELPQAMPAKLGELLDEPTLAAGPPAPPPTAPSTAATAPGAEPSGPGTDWLWPLALVSAGSAGLVTGVVVGVVGYAVAYRPLEQRAAEVQALEANGPGNLADAEAAQADMDELTLSTWLWAGGAVASALLGGGLLGTGLWLWPDDESEPAEVAP